MLTTDTLNDVVDRINQSDAGVTAVFNPTTEQIEFVQNTLGSAATIDLQNDSSNFLQATKLNNVNVVAGLDPEDMQSLESVGAFASVESGEIIVNGQQISY